MKTEIVQEVTIAEAYQTLVQAARLYFSKDCQGRYRVERRRARPLCLIGPSGIGKTEIVRQAAQALDLAFVSYSITHHTRQSAIGLPQLVDGRINGQNVKMTEYTMSEIIASVYRTMERSGKKEGILFLDEFNCCSESLRPIMLQLLQDKSFGPHPIPDGWMLVLAGNPSEYNRAATDLDAVTADRMRMVYVRADYPAWREYARRKGFHPAILSYLEDHPEHFYVYRRSQGTTALVTARGWEDLSVTLLLLEESGEGPDLPLIAQFIQSGDAARGFFSHWQIYKELLASGLMDRILKGDRGAAEALRELRENDKWGMLSALLHRLTRIADGALGSGTSAGLQQAGLDIAADTICGAVSVCREGLAGSQQLDYFNASLFGNRDIRALAERVSRDELLRAIREAEFGEEDEAGELLKRAKRIDLS